MYKDDGKTQRSLFSGLNSDWKSAGLPPSTDSNAVKGRKLRFLLLKAAYPMDNKKAFKPIMPILLSPYLSEVYYRKSDIMRYYNAVKGNGTISEDNNKRAQNILLPILFRKNMDAVHKPDYFRLRINGNDQQRISRYGRKFEHLFRTDAFFKKKKAKCSYYFVKNIKENITYGNWMTDTKDNIDKTDNYYFHWCMSGYFLAGVNKMSHNQFDLDKLELYSLDKKYLYPFNSWEQFAKMKGDEIKRVKKFNNAVAVKKYLNKTRISRKDFVFRCRNFGGEHANKTTLTKRCVAHFIREKAIREWATRIETVYTDSYAK
jgi:hypothetical protein